MTESQGQRLDTGRLEGLLDTTGSAAPLHLIYHESCVSTNAECLNIGLHGRLVVADHQSGGRGRRGNDWFSPDAGNIYMSLGLDVALPADLLGLIALQAGCSTAGVLRDQGFAPIGLKWPNDLMFDGRKLGGILIETRSKGPGRFFLAIGLGVNATADSGVFASIERPVASLVEAGEMVDRESLIAGIAGRICNDVAALSEDRIDSLITDFLQLDAWLGRPVRVSTRKDETWGVYEGIERDGRIRVLVDGQGALRFAAAEISLREGA